MVDFVGYFEAAGDKVDGINDEEIVAKKLCKNK